MASAKKRRKMKIDKIERNKINFGTKTKGSLEKEKNTVHINFIYLATPQRQNVAQDLFM